MPALIRYLMSFFLPFIAEKGLGSVLEKTALSQGLKQGLPKAAFWGTMLGPGIYDAMKETKMSGAESSSNAANLSRMHQAMASPPPTQDNVKAMMALLEGQGVQPSGDANFNELMGGNIL